VGSAKRPREWDVFSYPAVFFAVAAKMIRVVHCRAKTVEHDALIADDSNGPVRGMRIHTPQIYVVRGV